MRRDAPATWHLITGEYPPAPGGVSDYTERVASGLARAGDTVHVWSGPPATDHIDADGVHVHACGGAWTRADLKRIDQALERVAGPRHLVVQWVPHAFGRRSLNLGFCRWVRQRGLAGDRVDVMAHEPFLAFHEGSWRQDVAAAVHRLMVRELLREARRVWVSVPAWAERLRPWAPRSATFCWLPVPSNVPLVQGDDLDALRARVASRDDVVVGHFGPYDRLQRGDFERLIPKLLDSRPTFQLMMLGRGSDVALEGLRLVAPHLQGQLHATGPLDAASLSRHLQVCDVMLQPYVDGASTRRTTLMAALAHGVPVVTTVGRLSEPFWRDSGAVCAVPAGDFDAVVDATASLVSDVSRRQQLSAAARDLYTARFDITHTITAMRDDRCEAL